MVLDGLFVTDADAAAPDCRAVAQAADLVRSIVFHGDARDHFINRLNEHLRDTGLALPARFGPWWLADDANGGFIVRVAASSG